MNSNDRAMLATAKRYGDRAVRLHEMAEHFRTQWVAAGRPQVAKPEHEHLLASARALIDNDTGDTNRDRDELLHMASVYARGDNMVLNKLGRTQDQVQAQEQVFKEATMLVIMTEMSEDPNHKRMHKQMVELNFNPSAVTWQDGLYYTRLAAVALARTLAATARSFVRAMHRG